MSATTLRLQGWLEQFNTGDARARGQLIGHACERLRGLARHMLHRGFPRVRQVLETDDVLQNAMLRLNKALQDPNLRIGSVADFLRLATVQIRRELIDLARRHFGPARPRLVSPNSPPDSAGVGPMEPPDSTYAPGRLLDWAEFHAQVEKLPDEEREVFELLWYQELAQAEAAEVLKVSVPTIKRRWLSARLLLQKALPGSLSE